MKKLLAMAFVLLSFARAPLTGQILPCGTSIEDQISFEPRLLENIKTAQESPGRPENGAIQYVPIYYHLVGDPEGKGRARHRDILDNICRVNQAFSPMEMRFFLKPHPTYGIFNESINDNNVFNNQSAITAMKQCFHPKAINIYVVNKAVGNATQPGETIAFFSPSNDWIVAKKANTTGREQEATIPHEIGHFFSLQHTFFGYENNPFDDENDPTWPNAPDPAPWSSVVGYNIITEKANGSNCSTAADKLCDTPADYNFGFSDAQNDCLYDNKGARDPDGRPINDLMEENYMSYFSRCNYVWTPQQQNVILADRNKANRDYLDNNFQPLSLDITTPEDLLAQPDAGAVTPSSNVLFSWKKVTGATFYLLEVDLSTTFSSSRLQSIVTRDTAYVVLDLLPNFNYHWRVRPFNEYVTCAEAKTRSFKPQITNTLEISQLEAMQISPNPTTDGVTTQLGISASESFSAMLRMVDALGKDVMAPRALEIFAGITQLPLPTQPLPLGLYFVVLEGAEGRAVRKLVR